MKNLLSLAFSLLLGSVAYAQVTTYTDSDPAGSRLTVAVTPSKPLPVGGARAAITDGSSTITTGGTSQVAIAANTSRRYLMCQNIDTTNVEDMWLRLGAAAAVNAAASIRIPTGAAFTMEDNFISTDTVNVIAATTGHKYTCIQG